MKPDLTHKKRDKKAGLELSRRCEKDQAVCLLIFCSCDTILRQKQLKGEII